MLKEFKFSYPDFHKAIEDAIFPGIRICEIGPSGQPSIKSSCIKERGLDYSIIDIETLYWDEYNPEVKKYNIDLQKEFDPSLEGQFDLVFSQMVLEHIEEPENFHKGIFKILKPGGTAVHLYANPYSLPALTNNVLPEFISEYILKKINNRNLAKNHKYPAYYRWCFTSAKSASRRIYQLGFRIKSHTAYMGHNYFQSVPLLNWIEKVYSWKLSFIGTSLISTLSLLHVKKQ